MDFHKNLRVCWCTYQLQRQWLKQSRHYSLWRIGGKCLEVIHTIHLRKIAELHLSPQGIWRATAHLSLILQNPHRQPRPPSSPAPLLRYIQLPAYPTMVTLWTYLLHAPEGLSHLPNEKDASPWAYVYTVVEVAMLLRHALTLESPKVWQLARSLRELRRLLRRMIREKHSLRSKSPTETITEGHYFFHLC